MKCPKCEFDNPDSDRFCGECGAQLHPVDKDGISRTKTIHRPLHELIRGITFADRYEIIEELGRGGMGTVYKVFDKKIKEKVALKLLKPEIAADEKMIERFSNELKLARKISHSNVCGMYHMGEEEATQFIIMEYVPGGNLKGLIKRIGKLPQEKAIFIAKQVCEGLIEAHKLRVVHRDLKPQNIMIDRDGNARIMDFGIARSLETKGMTEAGMIIGTPEYMSPEQVEGEEADQRSDIYSMGIILYEMVTGRVPFEGKTPMSVAIKHKAEVPPAPQVFNTQIPEDLSGVILKCMEKAKGERYQSAEELLSELRKIEESVTITKKEIPHKKPKPPKTTKISFSLKKLFLPPAIVLGAIALIVVLTWIFSKREGPTPPTTSDTVVSKEDFMRGATRISGDLMVTHLIKKIEPVYPREAKEKEIGGEVVLDVKIDEKGSVQEVRVLKSIPLLDQAAVDAVKQWKYKPMLEKGKAVPVVFAVRVGFKLE